MRQMKKTAVAIITVLLIITFTANAFASGTFYEKVESEQLSMGVTQKQILRFTQDGWLNANVLYVDLDNQTTGLDFLQSSNGLTTKESLSSMASKKNNVIGAINADFFYVQNPDSPMGIMVKDGQMISNTNMVHNFASLYVTNQNSGFADYLTSEMKVLTDKGKEVQIQAINKITWEYRMITLIDRNWGTHSPGAAQNLTDHVEVVVVENKVVEIRRGQDPAVIPENGYIIFAKGMRANDLLQNLQLGDELELKVTMNPDIENIKFAIGGGTLLVKDGVALTTFTQDVSGNHPRTAVGITKNRRQLILVTVDGRHTSYRGLTGARMAQLMIELGSHEAIMMDGGGSTTMVTRSLGEFSTSLVNTPSDGAERRIINGLAIVSTVAPGTLNGIKAEPEHPFVFVNSPRKIIGKAFDENFNPLTVDPSMLKFTLKKGSGLFVNDNFIPDQAGEAIIEVDYYGRKAEVKLTVLDAPAHLEIKPSTIQLAEGRTARLTVVGVSSLGYRSPIDVNVIGWKDTKGLGTVAQGVYTAGSLSGESTLEAKFGNTTAIIPVSVGTQEKVIDLFEELKMNFSSYPQEVTGSISLSNNGRNGTKGISLEYDFTGTEVTRAAYMNYENGGILLPGQPLKVGVWVHATQPSTQWIRGRIVDAKGTQHVIDFKKGVDWNGWRYVEATIPANIPSPIKLDRIYVAETDGTQKVKGSLIFDDLQVSTGTQGTQIAQVKEIKDPLYKPFDKQGRTIMVHTGFQLQKETLLDRLVMNNIVDKANRQQTQILFTGAVNQKLTSRITNPIIAATSGYSHQESEELLVIRMDNSKKGFRPTDFNQWPWFNNLIDKNQKNNIIILLPQPIWGEDGFTDLLEADLFAEMLTKEAEKGKNVFVIHGGKDLQVNISNGVRYISTGTYQTNTQKMPSEVYRYIEFNLNGKDLTYQIKSLFN